MGAVLLSELSLQLNRDLFHLRIASFEKFLVALAEAVEGGRAVDDGLALSSASAAAERVPMAFRTFIVAVCGYADEFFCHISANELIKGVFIDVTELPFIEHVEVAGEHASVALDYRITGAHTRHRAVFGWSAEKHTDVVVEIAHADRMPRTEILVVLVKGNLQELGVSFGCE